MATLAKILLVEDEPDIRAIAKLALEVVGGYTVALAESGAEALAVYQRFQPDLILLDVMMPGMDGIETFDRLRALAGGRLPPVVFMTAKVQRHEVERYRSLGALDVISKPFDPMTLSAVVQRIWDRYNGLAP
ncbi:MAG: response regulator [Chloroflexota bacterium]|nr:response regulator [Dehalococcoidia bacterium]MDW8252565.1 response regulator [Chloroflexota bacterium]